MALRNSIRSIALVLICLAGPVVAQAQLFGDDDARRAILDLRQRFDQAVIAQNRLVQENTQLRRSMLQLQSDISSLHDDMARLRGRDDELEHELAQVKAQQVQLLGASRNQAGAASEPPAENSLEASAGGGVGPIGAGTTAVANPAEKQQFDAALRKFQGGDFKGAQSDFATFVKQYPKSSLAADALFWLGNAQYATRNYRQAITNFQSLLSSNPNSARAPEALLSIASCQTELGDRNAARTTLESLVKRYPQSKAAQAAHDRLAKQK